MKKYILTSIIFCLFSCTDFVDQVPEYKIQEDMIINVNRFFYEANIRRVSLKKENLIVSTSDDTSVLLPIDAAGYFTIIGGQKYVTLWDEAYYYFIRTHKPEAAERLLFHEMGHAFGRGHNNNPNSIMCQCMPSDYYVGNDSLRRLALDELMIGLRN